ncbi:3-isopropylmalate dehydratase small subunit [Marinobacter sp. AL4B]|uniref:3-isopropylmalate dehydratase small subunit n=1 Tax=Marinobacter sp. AL4B TaxID=2871173 RepID=UPI001CAA5A89|nr:3-isopropylmalate dehydratase small subunit [Marinobacter sp. AL4B]MBZ0333013.1 3-isopropylmalate dehydratase small subunit [Marinobacter sp. AL4B]
MEPFRTYSGVIIPLDRSNVDTDAILPKQYLKVLEKTGFGDFLFDDERYLDPGDVDIPVSERRPDPEHILNRAPYDHGSILLTRANFGCGSSREHAVWALMDFGIRTVLATSYSDIFYNNCFNNGLLPVILDEGVIDELFAMVRTVGTLELSVDLENCKISAGANVWEFSIEPGRRENLLSGLDEIGRTLTFSRSVKAYETKRKVLEPWLFE